METVVLNLFYCFLASVPVGFSAFSMAFMLQYGMSEGNILSFYGKLLSKLPPQLAKPLGTCVFCSGFHIAWILSTIIAYISSFPTWLYIIQALFTTAVTFVLTLTLYRNLNYFVSDGSDQFMYFFRKYVKSWYIGVDKDKDSVYARHLLSRLSKADLKKCEHFFNVMYREAQNLSKK